MGGALLTTLTMENHRPFLSMDSSSSSSHDESSERELQQHLSSPPDINLPLLAEPSPPPEPWNLSCDNIFDAHLYVPNMYETDATAEIAIVNHLPKIGRKYAKRLDSIWGAWFFFSFYFRPSLIEKSRCKVTMDGDGVSGYDKSDLQLDVFLVQHDMENMYMWVFKERPENALGKMQLRSYMNGHSRQGERPFPFSADRGFVRSHRMQRKHYRGLSNPQCVHGIEVVRNPNLMVLDDEARRRWIDLTGRDFNFSIPVEASDFGSWRNLPVSNDLELLPQMKNSHSHPRKLLNDSGLYLSTQPASNHEGTTMEISNKRRKDFSLHVNGNGNANDDECLDMMMVMQPPWMNGFSGVMRGEMYQGPVTAAKSIYEDEDGFLIIVSLPFVDLQRVKVTWRNDASHGIVKICCVSTAGLQFIKRHERTFKLTDPSPEHCPPGEFMREIPLPARIPEDAKLEAYCDETGTVLEILVPKHRVGPEEHEVRVCLRTIPWAE